jgi:hypothetical protein
MGKPGKPGKSGTKQAHIPRVMVVSPTGKRTVMTQAEYDERATK